MIDTPEDRPAEPSATPAWFDISTPDAARALSFYNSVFGWEAHPVDDVYTVVGTPDALPSGGIGQADQKSPYVGFVAYFPVDDVDEALARAEAAGGRRVMEPQAAPDGRIAVFADIDGNRVGVTSP
jgi:uncharacterized protein